MRRGVLLPHDSARYSSQRPQETKTWIASQSGGLSMADS